VAEGIFHPIWHRARNKQTNQELENSEELARVSSLEIGRSLVRMVDFYFIPAYKARSLELE